MTDHIPTTEKPVLSNAPASVRARAPWIALLLVPLLALASVLLPAAAASAAPGDVAGATLSWGFKQSFRSYLASPIAQGHVTASGVSTATPYGWSGGTGAVSGGTGTVSYPGTLQFQGHQGAGVPADEYALDVTISAVKVRVISATTAELRADVVSRDMTTTIFHSYPDVVIATLDLTQGTATSTATTLGYSGVPAAVTAEAGPAFNYAAGTALDPVSFSWPVEQAPVTEPQPEPSYGITAAPASGLANGDTVRVTGTLPASLLATAGASAGSQLTTGAYVMYCVQPAGAVGTSAGRPTGAQCDATRQLYLAAASGPQGATVTGSVTDGVWTFTADLPVADAFGTHHCADAVEGAEQCGVFLRLYHGFTAGNVANPYLYDRFVPVTFAAPATAPSFGITVAPTTGLADGDTVRVTGNLPSTITATRGASAGSPLVTGAYLMYCVQPTGAVGTSAGRPTGAQCDASRQLYLAAASGPQGATVTGSVADGVWTFTADLPATDAFGAHQCAATGAEQCGVFLRLYHGFTAGNVDDPYLYDRFVPVTFASAVPAPSIVAGVSTADVTGATISVAGSGFVGVTGAYAAVIAKGAEASVGQGSGTVGQPIQVTSFTAGGFTATLTAPAASLTKGGQYEVIVWKTRTMPDATTIYARTDVPFTAADWDAILPPTAPTPTAGSLRWGVKASFLSYVTGPIAGGSISTTGVSGGLGGFVFPQAGEATMSGGTGTVSYSGSVRFTGHAGALDLRLSEPRVRIDSATSGTLLLRVNGGPSTAFATLALGSANRTTDATGAIRYASVPATLTAAGSAAFSFEGSTFYPAGTALDPVSFTIGSPGSAPGGTVVLASATRSAARTPAATPPATEGIRLDGARVEGGEVTATADGFQPNESGILAVIYSEPTVLATDLTADADGRVSWTGSLPRGLTGEHTLTFQGSVSRGVVLDIAAAAELQCTVSDARLVWGFKEAFRAYIDGSIANGEWTTDGDVSYATPVFTWTGGTGGADLEAGALDVRYSGSVRFTGHGGILDTTIANPRVVVDGGRAVLLVDVKGTTQAGEAVDSAAVEFGAIDLAGITPARDGDVVTWTDAPVTLTAAGAAAFGTYPEGEELDPVTIQVTVDDACRSAVASPSPTAEEIAPEATASEGWPLWATVLLIALLAAAIVAAVVIALVRRRRA